MGKLAEDVVEGDGKDGERDDEAPCERGAFDCEQADQDEVRHH